MDGLGVPRSSFKSKLWLSARRKKPGRKARRTRDRIGKENIYPVPGSRCHVSGIAPCTINGAIISDPDILDYIGPATSDAQPKGVREPFTAVATNDWIGSVLTMALIHQVPPSNAEKNNDVTMNATELEHRSDTNVPEGIFENVASDNATELEHRSDTNVPEGIFENVASDNATELEHRSDTNVPEGIFENVASDNDIRNYSENITPSSTSSCSLNIDNEDDNNEDEKHISGRRLFDVKYLFHQMAAIDHSPFSCTFKDLLFVEEYISGFKSNLVFKCRMCGVKEIIKNDNSDINQKVVQAVVCSGSGFAQLAEYSAHFNMPCLSEKTFIKENMLLGDILHDVALESMVLAGLEERELAIKNNNIDEDGVPFIIVVADASWGKRSYRGSNYNSLSGVATIIGFETKKVLILGIRNSYCSIRAMAKTRNIEAKGHKCFKNWSGTSTAMEADGVVEGFKCSIEMHGLKFTKLIGDGDSSVISALNEALPYGHTTMIEKIECSYHLLRNYCTKLKSLVKKTENRHGLVPITLRKCLEKNILRLRKAIKGAVDYNSKIANHTLVQRVAMLQEDLRNGPCHIFGDHSGCKLYFCKGPQLGEENLVTRMKECGLWYDIYSSLSHILNNTESLLIDKNNNIVESFNGIIAKFVGGKRINYSSRGSYEARCYAAAIKHNTQSLVETLNKTNESNETNEFLIKYVEKHKQILKRRSRSDRKAKRVRKNTGADEHYGDIEAEADLEATVLENKKEMFLKGLDKTQGEVLKIERETIGQASNPEWVKQRKLRLTASMFGQVCKMKASTSCKNTVKTLLYSTFKGCDATRYGNRNESIAAKEFETLLGIKITPCGLFIDVEHPYLGASPDGLIGEGCILEIKCPSAAAGMTPEEAIQQKKKYI